MPQARLPVLLMLALLLQLLPHEHFLWNWRPHAAIAYLLSPVHPTSWQKLLLGNSRTSWLIRVPTSCRAPLFRLEKASKEPPKALLSSPAQEKLALVGDGKERSGEYFIAEVGGFPRWMERGRFYDVNRVHQKEGGRLLLLRVLLLQLKEGTTLVGQPFLDNIRVSYLRSLLSAL